MSAKTYITDCGTCGNPIHDYPSNRKKTSSGRFYCSAACRVQGTIKPTVHKTESLCKDCGETKPASEFYPDRKSKNNGGLQYHCKGCVKKRRTAYYDANTQTVIERCRKYAAAHPEVKLRSGKRSRARSTKLQRAARRALNVAVNKGEVVKATSCSQCGYIGWLYGHHHNGYEREHWLDVVWVCASCHAAAHGKGPQSRRA